MTKVKKKIKLTVSQMQQLFKGTLFCLNVNLKFGKPLIHKCGLVVYLYDLIYSDKSGLTELAGTVAQGNITSAFLLCKMSWEYRRLLLDWLNIAGQLYSHTKNSQEVFSNVGYLEQMKEQDKSREYLLNQKEEGNNPNKISRSYWGKGVMKTHISWLLNKEGNKLARNKLCRTVVQNNQTL